MHVCVHTLVEQPGEGRTEECQGRKEGTKGGREGRPRSHWSSFLVAVKSATSAKGRHSCDWMIFDLVKQNTGINNRGFLAKDLG